MDNEAQDVLDVLTENNYIVTERDKEGNAIWTSEHMNYSDAYYTPK